MDFLESDETADIDPDLPPCTQKDKAKELRRQQYQKNKALLAARRKEEKAKKKEQEKNEKLLKRQEKDQKLWEAITSGSRIKKNDHQE